MWAQRTHAAPAPCLHSMRSVKRQHTMVVKMHVLKICWIEGTLVKTDFSDLAQGVSPPDYYTSAHWDGWTTVSHHAPSRQLPQYRQACSQRAWGCVKPALARHAQSHVHQSAAKVHASWTIMHAGLTLSLYIRLYTASHVIGRDRQARPSCSVELQHRLHH